jgi:hypothetical protein
MRAIFPALIILKTDVNHETKIESPTLNIAYVVATSQVRMVAMLVLLKTRSNVVKTQGSLHVHTMSRNAASVYSTDKCK